MKLEDAQPNMPVKYAPPNTFDRFDTMAEEGMVSSKNKAFVFVKFFTAIAKLGYYGATAQACRPEDLTDI